jgi:hypothetical protein
MVLSFRRDERFDLDRVSRAFVTLDPRERDRVRFLWELHDGGDPVAAGPPSTTDGYTMGPARSNPPD